jgi:hypothetical protein
MVQYGPGYDAENDLDSMVNEITSCGFETNVALSEIAKFT